MRNEIEDRFENKMKMTRQVLEHRVREEEDEARSRWQRKRVVLREEVSVLEAEIEEAKYRRQRQEEERSELQSRRPELPRRGQT